MQLLIIILWGALGFLAQAWLSYLEDRKLWTLRLRVAVVYDYVVILYSVGFLFMVTIYSRQLSVNTSFLEDPFWWLLATLNAVLIGCVYFFHLLSESRVYRRLRWKAWTGSSRTGIPPRYVSYIGDGEDWLALKTSVGRIKPDPVEWGAQIATPFSKGIGSDPTDLLKGRAELDDKNETLWIPRKKEKSSIYLPIEPNQSVSLLWGSKSNFRQRCSRGIISVPRPLLKTCPQISGGLDGRPICLAYGILGRNKGLEPSTLICNLETNKAFRTFEEGSLFWPRPSKTLRGLYRKVFEQTFSLLGSPYITAATELALLIADVPSEVLQDWLSGDMEQQDITLNHQAADNGASSADFWRLYRGQYAAMLINLSLHRRGLRLRPEILIYDAICDLENVKQASWSHAPSLSERRVEELELYGQGIESMIRAII